MKRVIPSKVTRICPYCKLEFIAKNFTHKYCDQCKCTLNKKSNRIGKVIGTGNLGAAIECLVTSDLLLKGWSVFRSMSPNCFCDLIAIKSDIVMMIEVRSGARNPIDNSLIFGRTFRSEKVTHFAVAVPGENRVLLIEVGLAKDKVF